MRYDQVRQLVQEHFRDLLRQAKETVAAAGPPDQPRLDALRASQGLARGDPATWLATVYPSGEAALLSDFCARRGIPEADLTEANRRWLLQALEAGHASIATDLLDHVNGLQGMELCDDGPRVRSRDLATPEDAAAALSVAEVALTYFDEIARTKPLAVKTALDRKEALALLDEVTGQKSITTIDKSDAQEVKRVLLRLPKNRSKMPETRGKTLKQMLAVEGVEVISPRRVSTHLSNLDAFFKWAEYNHYVSENVFAGMQIRTAKRSRSDDREGFTGDQLRVMYRHLTANPDGLVRSDTHKWGSLIGMFSGMRLNEVAQLDLDDIKRDGEVWYFDVTIGGSAVKSLKTTASERRVPVHRRLIECGLLDYVASLRTSGKQRLFSDLPYSAANGYGRNLGRWFNEAFLPSLEMKKRQLVYHSFRHTMATRLAQADASEKHVPAIIGHAQSGMTYSTYMKDGFLPAQLKTTIDLFDF